MLSSACKITIFFMRLSEKIVQNTIKIIDLRKNTWKIL